jgi:hypothetical protein
MKLTQQSIEMFSFINKNYKHLLQFSFNKTTKNNLKNIYIIIQQSYKKYNHILTQLTSNNDFIKQSFFDQLNIVFPIEFKDSDFPKKVIIHIHNKIIYQICWTFIIKGRKINIYIGYENKPKNGTNEVIEKIIIWLHILSHYSSNKCAQELSIYLFMTNLKKLLPNKGETIDCIHVNSAFTHSCRPKSEIVIYRSEEWFKVLIHETFHSFGLDFSHMHETTKNVSSHMNTMFNVDVEILLFESYTEFWAELMNALLFAYLDYPIARNNYSKFIDIVEKLAGYQRIHSVLQMNKILDSMNLSYNSIIHNTESKIRYKENTNVFAYYIIKSILFVHFNEMINWCQNNNNGNILQFRHSLENVDAFCIFIKEIYNSQLCFSFISKLKNNYNNNSLQMDLYNYYI